MSEKLEQRIKKWMRVGLADDKWIQLYPGAPKWHPWFNEDKTINVSAMAGDAMEAYHVRQEDKTIMDGWASDVAREALP